MKEISISDLDFINIEKESLKMHFLSAIIAIFMSEMLFYPDKASKVEWFYFFKLFSIMLYAKAHLLYDRNVSQIVDILWQAEILI